MNTIDSTGEWERVAERIKHDTKICIVLGKTDSGKSTLCKYLIHTWMASGLTVSLKIFTTPSHQNDYTNPNYLHFVRNTAPEGFLVQTLHAVKMMVDKSHQHGSQITLVDTTGFIDGPVARILKLHKIEMLHPQWILALQAERQRYRSEKYKAYFKSAKTVDCSIQKVVFPSCIN